MNNASCHFLKYMCSGTLSNKPPFNEIPGIMNDILQLDESYSKMYGGEP